MLESSSWQATFGKMLIGIRVANREGKRISFGRASARFFLRIVSGFVIGSLLIPFARRKQALYDMIAGCVVLKA